MGGEGLKIDLPVSHVLYKKDKSGATLYIANTNFTKVRTLNEFFHKTGGNEIGWLNPYNTYFFKNGKDAKNWLVDAEEVYTKYLSEKGLKSKSVFETPRDLYDFERYLRDEKYLKNDNLLEF